jgi:hypothetical protein
MPLDFRRDGHGSIVDHAADSRGFNKTNSKSSHGFTQTSTDSSRKDSKRRGRRGRLEGAEKSVYFQTRADKDVRAYIAGLVPL